MLVATSEVGIGAARMRTTLVLERAIRASISRHESLTFDTRFAPAIGGKPESVGHVLLMTAGRLTTDVGQVSTSPIAFVLSDDELMRPLQTSRTFRVEGPQLCTLELRLPRDQLRVPIGLSHGPRVLPPDCWDAAQRLIEGAHSEDPKLLENVIDALARAGVVAGSISGTLCYDEPAQFRRLWSALKPLYGRYGATVSVKQLADALGISTRQVVRDAKELASAFGFGRGYRDALLAVRLRAAVLLLSAPEGSIATIANLVGYGSTVALARAFRDARLPAPASVRAVIAPPLFSCS